MKILLKTTYKFAGRTYTLFGEGNCIQDERAKIQFENKNGIITGDIIPAGEIEFTEFSISFKRPIGKDERIFSNGYQSWTLSREYAPNDKIRDFLFAADKLMNSVFMAKSGVNRAGDAIFIETPHKRGIFTSSSYGYIRKGEITEIYGSLTERTGFTFLEFDGINGIVTVKKDLAGVKFSEKRRVFDFAVIKDTYDAAFDKYFELMGVTCRQKERLCGYTTWYNYYGNITEDIVRRDLKALYDFGERVDIFQIDDGYQAAIGDWLITDEKKFPSGMKAVADSIHSNNMKAGLWLAPFGAVKSSRVFSEHPDWIIRDEKGEPYVAGANWGKFYAIDIYNEGAREYIRHFFDVVLNDWGYDMVKLDFLYAACILPIHNKTRGEIMCDAMDLIRECCGDKLVLGCGVPLMPAFGKVDFCRIGADAGLDWRRHLYINREAVSTCHTVNNSIFRRHLDGRAFMNDPDVFLLRESNMHMSFKQRKLLAKVNGLFGSLLFTSDNVGEYGSEQEKVYRETMSMPERKIISAEYTGKEEITVKYTVSGENKTLVFNPETGEER